VLGIRYHETVDNIVSRPAKPTFCHIDLPLLRSQEATSTQDWE
jgi:hypothetical protein